MIRTINVAFANRRLGSSTILKLTILIFIGEVERLSRQMLGWSIGSAIDKEAEETKPNQINFILKVRNFKLSLSPVKARFQFFKKIDLILNLFYFFLVSNKCLLFLLTFDTPFQSHHSYKKFENRSVWGALKFQTFGILLKGFFVLFFYSKISITGFKGVKRNLG